MNPGEKWFVSIVSSVLIGVAVIVGMIARSDGKIDHCWVELAQYQTPSYAARGHRNWQPNVTIAIAPTAEEAEAKRKLLCP